MASLGEEQQFEWGRQLGAALVDWPRLKTLCENAGIPVDPSELIPILLNGNKQETAPLAALFTLIEGAMAHHANQAEEDNYEWQRKITALQSRIDDITAALTRTVGGGGGANTGRRISDDPDKFGGTEKNIAKRQQQYVTWRSQIQRCFGMDQHIFTSEYRRIQHIASLLKDDAYDAHRENFETITDNPTDASHWHWKTYREVFTTLDNQYATLDLSRQAGIDFDNLWMLNKPFQNFIAEFDRLATKSGKTEAQKVEALKTKISQEVSDVSMIYQNRPEANDYAGWRKLFQSTYEDLQEKAHIDKLRNNRGARQPLQTRSNSSIQQVGPATTNITTNTDAGDPMVLDARQSPRPTREQCIEQRLCFYCKRPGHGRDSCEEKKKNDAKFGRSFQSRSTPFSQPSQVQPQQQRYAPRPQYPQNQFAQFSPQFGAPPYPQFAQHNPYSRIRTMESGFIEGELQSTASPSPSPPVFMTPSTTTPSVSVSNIGKPEKE